MCFMLIYLLSYVMLFFETIHLQQWFHIIAWIFKLSKLQHFNDKTETFWELIDRSGVGVLIEFVFFIQ